MRRSINVLCDNARARICEAQQHAGVAPTWAVEESGSVGAGRVTHRRGQTRQVVPQPPSPECAEPGFLGHSTLVIQVSHHTSNSARILTEPQPQSLYTSPTARH